MLPWMEHRQQQCSKAITRKRRRKLGKEGKFPKIALSKNVAGKKSRAAHTSQRGEKEKQTNKVWKFFHSCNFCCYLSIIDAGRRSTSDSDKRESSISCLFRLTLLVWIGSNFNFNIFRKIQTNYFKLSNFCRITKESNLAKLIAILIDFSISFAIRPNLFAASSENNLLKISHS